MAERLTRVHQQQFLQNLSVGFKQPGLIADLVAPRVPVQKQSDLYRIWGKNFFVDRSAALPWAPGTTPNVVESTWSSSSFFAKLFKLRHLVLDQELANADSDLDLKAAYTEMVTGSVELGREVRVANLFTNAANYSGGHTATKAGGQEWNTVPTNVLIDLQTAIRTVKQDAIVPANQLSVVIPDPVFDQSVKFNSDILDKIKYVERGIVTADLLAALLGVKEVLLAQVQAVAAGPESEGQNVLSGYPTSYLWGDNVWVGYIGAGSNMMTPSFARSFNWVGGTDGSPRRVKEYRAPDEGQEGAYIEVTEAIDEKVVFADAGYLLKNTSSTF